MSLVSSLAVDLCEEQGGLEFGGHVGAAHDAGTQAGQRHVHPVRRRHARPVDQLCGRGTLVQHAQRLQWPQKKENGVSRNAAQCLEGESYALSLWTSSIG